jgi:ABC-type multidrug transport system fused ATPase/permease subunit
MYVDGWLWAFTRGVRLRIAGATLAGLLSVLVGTARLALLGWVLGRLLAGDSLGRLAWPVAGVAALIALRGLLEYGRAMVAHHTAARVQARLRGTLYAQITALGPAHFTQTRTGDVILSVVEGVQQLEVYFGQYLPQLFVSALTPFLIFAIVAAIDLPLAGVILATASSDRTPTRPTVPSSSTRSRGCGRWPPSARAARAPDCSRSAGTRSSRPPCGCSEPTPWPAASATCASRSAPRSPSGSGPIACKPGAWS